MHSPVICLHPLISLIHGQSDHASQPDTPDTAAAGSVTLLKIGERKKHISSDFHGFKLISSDKRIRFREALSMLWVSND